MSLNKPKLLGIGKIFNLFNSILLNLTSVEFSCFHTECSQVLLHASVAFP